MEKMYQFEIEDERGVMKKSEGLDSVAEQIYFYFAKRSQCEMIFINRWCNLLDGIYRYEGTVFLANNKAIVFQVDSTSKMYWLNIGNRKFVGGEIKYHPDAQKTKFLK